jgi:hypothetical protein
MYPCWIDIRLGDVREQGFLELWNGAEYKRFRRLIREKKLLPKCTTCCALSDASWSKVPTLRRGLLRRGARNEPPSPPAVPSKPEAGNARPSRRPLTLAS